ncbi:MAG: hypothetical protein EOP85_17015 [Verrucomicrobiaceae bacterium]|nr:MAG: hypothetical protein EOP85_17015 [Verrucomicrobiaceae bacterium]
MSSLSSFSHHRCARPSSGIHWFYRHDHHSTPDKALILPTPPGEVVRTGGRREQILELARAGVAVGLGGIFVEVHPEPDDAKCDGPSALPISVLEAFLSQLKALDNLVKSLQPIEIV